MEGSCGGEPRGRGTLFFLVPGANLSCYSSDYKQYRTWCCLWQREPVRWNHINPYLWGLHWLLISFLAQFKVQVPMYNALYDLGPGYHPTHVLHPAKDALLCVSCRPMREDLLDSRLSSVELPPPGRTSGCIPDVISTLVQDGAIQLGF